MQDQPICSEEFASQAVKLYTALLAVGETEVSRELLKATMNAAAMMGRLYPRRTATVAEPAAPWGETGAATASGVSGEEAAICEALLKKSLFWICQVRDDIAQEHGGELFRHALRLLMEIRRLRADSPVGERERQGKVPVP